MRKAIAVSLALLSSAVFSAEDNPAADSAATPDNHPEVPSENTSTHKMTGHQKLNDCLLRSAQTADPNVTVREMRGWCTNGEPDKERSLHEDALRARLAPHVLALGRLEALPPLPPPSDP